MMIRGTMTAAALVSAALALGCGGDTKNAEDSASQGDRLERPAQRSEQVSAIMFTLRDAAGNVRNADEWIGKKPVVINFWGTWCGPCRREIPDMVKVYDEYRDQVEFLGIAMNDSPDKVNAFRSQFGMNWVMLMGDQQIAMQFGIQGIPTTFFVNAEGRIVQVEDSDGSMAAYFVGPRDYRTFKRAIETIIHASPRPS